MHAMAQDAKAAFVGFGVRAVVSWKGVLNRMPRSSEYTALEIYYFGILDYPKLITRCNEEVI